jgi:hypothetical protein
MSQLSPAQHGMWIAARNGVGTAYHMPVVIRLARRPDPDGLAKACHGLVQRHPVLGSAVAEADGVPRLVPAAEPPALQRASSVDEVVTRPFDLNAGPLARFALVGPDTLVVVAHHLVFDGGSKDVLVADLQTLLDGGLPGGPGPARTDPGAASGDGASALLAEATRFWAGRPHQAGETVVAGEVLRSRSTGEGALLEFPLDIPALDGLTRFEVLTAALHTLLASYGNAEVVTALDLSTRPEELGGEIGCWVNELPLSSRPTAAAPFRRFATGLRAELREIYAYRDVPRSRVCGRTRRSLPSRSATAGSPTSGPHWARWSGSPPATACAAPCNCRSSRVRPARGPPCGTTRGNSPTPAGSPRTSPACSPPSRTGPTGRSATWRPSARHRSPHPRPAPRPPRPARPPASCPRRGQRSPRPPRTTR